MSQNLSDWKNKNKSPKKIFNIAYYALSMNEKIIHKSREKIVNITIFPQKTGTVMLNKEINSNDLT